MKNERFDYIDIIKGICIIIMVILHSGSGFNKFFNLFNMSTFFICSGYCYNDKYSKSKDEIVVFFIRKLNGLYIPYVICNLVFLITNNLQIKLNLLQGTYLPIEKILVQSLKILLLHGKTELGGPTWFLVTLFGISIIYNLVSYAINKFGKYDNKMHTIFSLLLLVLGYICFLKKYSLFGFDRIFSYYSLYHMGYLMRKYSIVEKIKNNMLAFLASFFILIISSINISFSIVNNNYSNPLYLLLLSFFGFIFVYEISLFVIYKNKCCKYLTYIGRNTIPILCIHLLSFKLVSLLIIAYYKLPFCCLTSMPIISDYSKYWPLYTLFGILIPLVLNFYYLKLKGKIKIWMKNIYS